MEHKEIKWISVKRYECKINGHNKFWEIYIFDEITKEYFNGNQIIKYCFFTKYGKIGTLGKQSPIKTTIVKFERDKEAIKITNTKIFKGYSFIKDLIKPEDPLFPKLEIQKNEETVQENEDGFDFIDLK